MAFFRRGKKELLIGQAPSRAQRGGWRRRLRLALAGLAGCALLLWAFGFSHERTEERIVLLDLEQISRASRLFREDFGRCPHDVAELAHPPAGRLPYLPSSPRDPWGRFYTLQCPSRWDEDGVDVATRGPDGAWLGGDDMSTDL